MLSPKRVKYRKQQRRTKRLLGGNATRSNSIDFGDCGLMSLGRGFISARQIESARIAMTRHIKRGGKVWIRVFPDVPYTKKPAETRMGSGKGNLEKWVAPVRPGQIMFEVAGVNEKLAEEAIKRAIGKLPIKATFVKREY